MRTLVQERSAVTVAVVMNDRQQRYGKITTCSKNPNEITGAPIATETAGCLCEALRPPSETVAVKPLCLRTKKKKKQNREQE